MSNLRTLREARGWTGRFVAKKAGISAASLSRAERGKNPNVPTLIKICRAYDLGKIADQLEWLTR